MTRASIEDPKRIEEKGVSIGRNQEILESLILTHLEYTCRQIDIDRHENRQFHSDSHSRGFVFTCNG